MAFKMAAVSVKRSFKQLSTCFFRFYNHTTGNVLVQLGCFLRPVTCFNIYRRQEKQGRFVYVAGPRQGAITTTLSLKWLEEELPL